MTTENHKKLETLSPGTTIQPWDLPSDISGTSTSTHHHDLQLSTAVAQAEKSCILRALKMAGGKKTETAKILGISRKNLWEKMKNYEMS